MGFFTFSIIILLLSQIAHLSQGWWFFSANQESHRKNNNNNMTSKSVISEFSCMQTALQNIKGGCTKILADDELKSRISWHFSDCFQCQSGRPSFPHCHPNSKMRECVKNLDEEAYMVYLAFSLETSSICHQLRADAFRRQTERLVDELKRTSAEHASEKLGKIEEQGDMILRCSEQVHESIDLTTQQVAETSRIVCVGSQVLEGSRATLEKLAKFVLETQKQLHESHEHLVESSKLIIAAQDAIKSKQANMFHVIKKLFDLHSAMLFESRVITTLIVYSIASFIIYMLTSMKHANNVRHRLYLGLCAAILTELITTWYVMTDAEQQGWTIRMVRTLFSILASAQYLHAIFTYRDYEILNHKRLITLMEKVNNRELLTWDADVDSEVNQSIISILFLKFVRSHC